MVTHRNPFTVYQTWNNQKSVHFTFTLVTVTNYFMTNISRTVSRPCIVREVFTTEGR